MSEMTATRIGLAAATLLLWVGAAVALWVAAVPPAADAPAVAAGDVFPHALLDETADYARVARLLAAGAIAMQLIVPALLALRPPALPGRALVQGLATLLVVLAATWLAALPLVLAAQWWRRRHGLSRTGYLEYVVNPWLETAASLAVVCLAYAAAFALARRLGPRWWIAGAPALAILGAAAVLLQPLVLAPKLDPLSDARLAADVRRLGDSLGVTVARVDVRRASERTTRINAEVAGIGPTRRVILWDTLFATGRGGREAIADEEILFLAAHELAHVDARHLWKGLAWFALLAPPCVWLLARLVRVDEPRQAPRAVLVVLAVQLALLPFANALSRRYEAEADRLALGATRNPAAAEAMLARFAERNLAQPEPPRAWHAVFGTHPTLVERIGAVRGPAEAALRSPGAPPAGS